MNKYNFSFLLVLSIAFIGCMENKGISGNDAGEIIYTIKYPTLDSNSIFFDMMPQTMDYTFSKVGSKSEISAGMGLFKSAYIRRNDSKKFKQTVKMLNKKYQSTYTKRSFLELNPKYQGVDFQTTNEDTLVMGYNCKIASFNFSDDSSTYTIYYTTEIGGENPNANTPFEKIPGLMLKYTIENFGVMMDFTADKITINEVDHSIFEVSEDYSEITPLELKAQIESIFLMTE